MSNVLINIGFSNDDVLRLRNHAEEPVNGCSALLRHKAFSHDERAYKIISRRFGLDGEHPRTLQEIGNELGITRERVRQLEQKALRRFRGKSCMKNWETAVKILAHSFLPCDKTGKKVSECKENIKLSSETDNPPEKDPSFSLDVKMDSTGKSYLIIKGDPSSEKQGVITLTDEIFPCFYKKLMDAARQIGWAAVKKSTHISDTKKDYPRAYEKWTDEEERTLTEAFSQGADVQELAAILERQPSAIRTRLQKAGLLD